MKRHANKGRRQTPEHISKRIASFKVTWHSHNHTVWNKGKKTGIPPWRGKKRSAEDRKKMSDAKFRRVEALGYIHPPEVYKKIGDKLRGKPHLSEAAKQRMRGPNNWAWKGGVTSVNLAIRGSYEYFQWRRSVFERDDYRCFDCGERGGRLEVHHVYPFATYPRLRMILENGITLCKNCHLMRTRKGPRIYSYPLSCPIPYASSTMG